MTCNHNKFSVMYYCNSCWEKEQKKLKMKKFWNNLITILVITMLLLPVIWLWIKVIIVVNSGTPQN